MTNRARRGNRQKARFATLRARRSKRTALYEALEHRQREETARLQAARRLCVKTTGHPKTPTIELRRKEYIEIPVVAQSTIPSRPILTALAVAFALPLVVALAANIHPYHAMTAHVQTKQVVVADASITLEHVRTAAVSPARTAQHAKPVPKPRRVVTVPPPTAQLVEPAPQAVAPVQQPVAESQQPIAWQQHVVTAQPPATPSSRPAQVALAPHGTSPAPPRKVMVPAKPAVHAQPESPWKLSPDGTWTALIHAPADSRGADFTSSTGQIISLERSAIDGEAATVTIGWSRPVVVTISSAGGSATQTLSAPDDGLADFAAVARAVGPHLVNVGWTPLAQSAGVADYKVYRSSGEADDTQLVARLPATKHSWHDLQVAAQLSYRYDIVAETATGAVDAGTQVVTTPDELPVAPSSVLAGKGMFLYFSSIDGDARIFKRYDPEGVIVEAQKANIRVIELRMARGSCAMAQTSQAHAWLNRLLDAAARANISLIAWTVPRRVTTQDISQTLAAAAYKTPAGSGFAGLALDLETGDHYMGDGRKATVSLVQYIKTVRAAAGPHYLIVATVASPGMGNHTNEDYPYAKIAAYADVLQPMEYWHYYYETAHHEYVRREVAGAAAKAVARTRELAGRDIPVNVAGQTVDLEGTGSPSGREIMWSLNGAKSAGGIGETFFDWAGTRPDAWAAIQAFDW
jgi:hypothetical protein